MELQKQGRAVGRHLFVDRRFLHSLLHVLGVPRVPGSNKFQNGQLCRYANRICHI